MDQRAPVLKSKTICIAPEFLAFPLQETTVSSIKCSQCGLANFATDVSCKRCGAQLPGAGSVAAGAPQGIVLEDGYVLPPPPISRYSGVWRDGSKLVMSRDAELPPRCVKCNVPTHFRLKRRLSWHHPLLYILLFVALLIYLIVAMVVRKNATVEIGLCDEHLKKRRRDLRIAIGLLVAGLAGLALAIGFSDGTYLLLGFLGLIAALIYGIVAVRIVAPSKIDDQFVWLTGVNKTYLSELPPWPGR